MRFIEVCTISEDSLYTQAKWNFITQSIKSEYVLGLTVMIRITVEEFAKKYVGGNPRFYSAEHA